MDDQSERQEAFKQLLLDWTVISEKLLKELKNKHQKVLTKDNNARALRRLRSACEKAKRILSTSTSTIIEVDSIVDGIDFSFNITRA